MNSENVGCLIFVLALALWWGACQAEKFIDVAVAERAAAIHAVDGGAQ